MAFESRFWRFQIKKDINYIFKRLEISLSRLDVDKLDQMFSEVEIRLFIIMYSVRKLMDTKKVPDRVSDHKVDILEFSRKKRKGRMHPFSLFEDFYNLENPQKGSLHLREICNQFIHAYFFQPFGNSKNKLGTLFFVSDRRKDNCIYSVNIKHLLRKIKEVVGEYPQSIMCEYDGGNDEWKTFVK